MFIYISGSVHKTEAIRLACIRVLLCGHTPICPILMCRGMFKDDRLKQKFPTWYQKIVKKSLNDCNAFVYLTESCGCWQTKVERKMVPMEMPMIPFDVMQEWFWKNARKK